MSQEKNSTIKTILSTGARLTQTFRKKPALTRTHTWSTNQETQPTERIFNQLESYETFLSIPPTLKCFAFIKVRRSELYLTLKRHLEVGKTYKDNVFRYTKSLA